MSIRKLPIKIVIYYSKMLMIYSKAPHKSSVNFDFRLKWFFINIILNLASHYTFLYSTY
jgi:hypothetical protein